MTANVVVNIQGVLFRPGRDFFHRPSVVAPRAEWKGTTTVRSGAGASISDKHQRPEESSSQTPEIEFHLDHSCMVY